MGNGLIGILEKTKANIGHATLSERVRNGSDLFFDSLSMIYHPRAIISSLKEDLIASWHELMYSLTGYDAPKGLFAYCFTSAFNDTMTKFRSPYDFFVKLLEKTEAQITDTNAYRSLADKVDRLMQSWNDFAIRINARYNIWKEGKSFRIAGENIQVDNINVGKFVPSSIGERVQLETDAPWHVKYFFERMGYFVDVLSLSKS